MPWKIFTEEGRFCVWRVTEEGEKVKRLECYDAEQEAKDYMAALYANEPEAAKAVLEMYPTGEDLGGATMTTAEWEVKAAVRKKEQDGLHPASHYLVVEDPEHPTTWHLRVRDASGALNHRLMGAAWAALHGGYRGNRYEGPNKSEAIAKLKRLYKQEDMKPPKQTVKAIEDGDAWTLDVLGIPYGGPQRGRDRDGEYFDANTDLWLERITERPVIFYHGLSERKSAEVIGRETGWERRPDGVWFQVALDKTNALARRVWKAAKQGMARASTGAINHLVRRDPDGHLAVWPIGELSLLDETKAPINDYAVAVPAMMKAVYEQAGLNWPDEWNDPVQAQPKGTTVQRGDAHAGSEENKDENNANSEGNDMAENATENTGLKAEDVQQIVADALKADREERKAAAKAEEERKKEIDDAVKAERDKWEAEAAKARRLPFDGGSAPYVGEFGELRKYDNLDARDLAIMCGVLEAAGRKGGPGASENALKALVHRLNEDKGPVGTMGRRALKAMGAPFDGDAVKADEVDYTTQTSYGKEWVTAAYSQTLWEAIRLESGVASKLPSVEVPQGASTLVVPLEGADPTFYKVGEVTSDAATGGLSKPSPTVYSSKLGTGNQTLSLGSMGARVRWSGEEDEDSIIPFAPRLRSQMETAGQEYFDHVIIDGDTTTTASANINDAADTPVGNEAFLILDGMRHLCLVTNTANSRDAGALTSDDYLLTSQLLGAAGIYGLDRKKIAYIIDPNTYYATLRNVTEVKTKDVWGASTPTIEGGVLTQIWGTPIIPAHMHYVMRGGGAYAYKAQTNGWCDQDTASDNTTGSILAVRWDRWLLGWKRRMKIETDRDIEADVNIIVAKMRFGLIYFDTDACALSYDVTV